MRTLVWRVYNAIRRLIGRIRRRYGTAPGSPPVVGPSAAGMERMVLAPLMAMVVGEAPPDTSGFFKLEGGMVIHGPNFVHAPTFSLLRSERNTYTYPVDGWYWFDSMEEAYTAFGVPLPEPEEGSL